MGKETDLLDASRSGHYAVVEKVLSSRIKKSGPLTLTSLRRLPGPNTTDPRNGFTCLHYASLNGHKDIVHLLLEHGANPNILDHNGSSPLHLASWTGDYEVVSMLISNGNLHQKADINLKNKDNEVPLHAACQYGHTAVVSLLLTNGADPFIRNIRYETPLDLSSTFGRLDTIELLLQMRFDLLKDYLPINRDPLMASHGHHRPTHSPLHLASRNGHKQVVKLLLDLGFDVDFLTTSGTALHEAVLCGKVEVVRLLLDAGSDLFMEDDKGQKVDELLNGLNTPVAKQTKRLIQEHLHLMESSSRGAISPVSESTTVAVSNNSFCDPTEDLTLVDSMFQDELAMYQHEFEDLMDESDVQCISPPPGYTDVPPPDVIAQVGGHHRAQHHLEPHDAHHLSPSDAHHLGPSDAHHLDVDCVSPSSSVFSSSILSELQSIFDEHLNRNSADERNSQEFTEDPFGGLKPSTSFTLSDYRQQAAHRASAASDIVAHHQSFDAVYLSRHQTKSGNTLHPLQPSNAPLMSTSLSSQSNEAFGKPLTKRYQIDSSREAMQSSNYSLSSTASQDTRSSNPADGSARPPKPPRKARSKAKSLESGRALLATNLAKSDFNVDYTAESEEERSVPSQRQQVLNLGNEQVDSDHSSSHQNSVISNDKEKPKRCNASGDKGKKVIISGAGNGTAGNDGGLASSVSTTTTTAAAPSATARNGVGGPSQAITFTQSIDDFYMLYDQVANSTDAGKSPKATAAGSKGKRDKNKHKHSSSLDDILQDSGGAAVTSACKGDTGLMGAKPPSPRSAEVDIFQIIEPLKQQFQQIQPPVRRKRKKKEADLSQVHPDTSSSSPQCQSSVPPAPRTTSKRDNWTLTDFELPDEPPSYQQTASQHSPNGLTSPRKRSVAVWTVEAGNRENSSLVANRVQVKKKVMTEGRKGVETSAGNAVSSGKPSNERLGGGGRKSESHYNAYCETLKCDRKGEKENPFAGLCRGGLTPAKSNPAKSDVSTRQANGHKPAASERKKKTVELSEVRKSLRGKRETILSGRAESLTKLSKLSVYQESTTSTGTDVDTSGPVPNIYATLRKPKKKCKSLNGDRTPTIATKEGGVVSTFEAVANKTGLVGSESWNNLLKASKPGNEPVPGGAVSNSIEQAHQMYLWLREHQMEQYKGLLISNGYDDLSFMDANVMDDSDLLEIGIINAAHREVILKAAQHLPKTAPKLTKAEIKTLTVPEWLSMLHLDAYKDTFARNGMDQLRKVHNIWEVELETMLEIDKSGYRRRILYSLSDFNRESILMDDDDIASWLTDVQSSADTEKEDAQNGGGAKPWKEWKHARQELVSGCCQYSVRYLGSTLVRELRGIDSTRASMGKLKSAHAAIPPLQIPKIILSISCQGVQFKDFKSNHLICEHEIRNIHCICQDSEDLNYFAYITKDFESNNHYCHVFMCQQTELVTEIILTLGQAFEIAYQIVLEQYNIHATAANEVQITSSTVAISNGGSGSKAPTTTTTSNAPSSSSSKQSKPTTTTVTNSTQSSGKSEPQQVEVRNANNKSDMPPAAAQVGATAVTETGANDGPPIEAIKSAAAPVAPAPVAAAPAKSTAGRKLNFFKSKNIASQVMMVATKLRTMDDNEYEAALGNVPAGEDSTVVKGESHPAEESKDKSAVAGGNEERRPAEEKDELKTSKPAPVLPHPSEDNRGTSKAPPSESQVVLPTNPNKATSAIISEDIYAVVDKSKKGRKKSLTDAGINEANVSPVHGTGKSSSLDDPYECILPPEHRPVPPVRSSSTTGTTGRPEIKPKPPLRVASMCKPEVSPKPKILTKEGRLVTPSVTPTPPVHVTSFVGRPGIKPSIAARQAQLISCTSPQPPMTPSPAPSH